MKIFCEPQLGKRNLYPNKSLPKLEEKIKTRMNVISYCDGINTIFDISEIINKNLEEVLQELQILEKEKLIDFK